MYARNMHWIPTNFLKFSQILAKNFTLFISFFFFFLDKLEIMGKRDKFTQLSWESLRFSVKNTSLIQQISPKWPISRWDEEAYI